MTDTHRCIAGGACRAYTVTDGQRHPALTEQPHTLCPGCTTHHHDAIRRLVRDHAMLRITLGEHQPRDGAPVASTPSPAVLIDTTTDRLMADIIEWADYAAAIVSDALHTTQPDGRRRLAKAPGLDGTPTDPQPDTIAERTWEHTRPNDTDALAAYIAIVEPHLDTLATAPTQPVQVWAKPQRCNPHAEAITHAKRLLQLARDINDPQEITDSSAALQAAYAAAGACNECCGWGDNGQARHTIDISGLDVLQRLTRLHHLTRQHLGQTKLRHRYTMPCPRCGSPVGRDDGANIVTCDNQECTPKGPSSWTEREYKWLAGQVSDDERTRETTKYLLAESYSRLDSIQALVDNLDADTRVNDAPAVQLILGALKPLLAGHLPPADRKIATDKAAAQQRQHDEDNWAWKREQRYKKPKKKPRPKPHEGNKIHPDSLLTVTDIQPDTIPGRPACRECNLIHAGECA